MKYKCISCDHVFEVKEGVKPRCPQCMKIHDLEPVSGFDSAQPKKSKRLLGGALVVLVLCAVAVYFIVEDDSGEAADKKPKVTGLSTMLEELGIAPLDRVEPAGFTPEIAEFAARAADGKDGLEAVQAVFDGIQKLRKERRWTPYHQREPRLEQPLPASRLLTRLNGGDDPPYEAISYELAALLLASVHSLDVDARMVEIYRFAGEKKPADGYGKLGRYGVVSGEGETGGLLFDPYSGRVVNVDKAEFFVLNELEAAAPYYGISALAKLTQRDTQGALAFNKIAVGLAPENPYFRAGRGMIFLASGAPTEALLEFEKAVQKRGDAVTRTNLAEILLMADPTGRRSEAEIQIALNETPDFARAHAVLAIVYLINREVDKAEQELDLAERLEPTSPVVAMYWAQFYLAQAKNEEAISKAQDAVRFSGDSVNSLIGLAQIYQSTARYSEMREVLDGVYARIESPAIVRELREVFQYDPDTGDDEALAEDGEDGDDTGEPGQTGDDQDSLSGGSGLKLDDGLGGNLGGGQGSGFGGGKRLNIDLNLK